MIYSGEKPFGLPSCSHNAFPCFPGQGNERGIYTGAVVRADFGARNRMPLYVGNGLFNRLKIV